MILLLDVMSTLVYDPYARELPDFFGMTLREVMQKKTPEVWQRFELDELSEQTFYETFFLDGTPVDGAGLREALYEAYEYIEGIEPLLRELRAAGVAMHTLSNYPVWWELIEAKLGLSEYVAWSFVSCKMGARKPAPGAYLYPLNTLGVLPEECLFVDDREENCAAARAVGMHAVRFEDAATLRAALVERGVLP